MKKNFIKYIAALAVAPMYGAQNEAYKTIY